MITMQAVHRTLGSTHALRGLTLTASTGQVTCVLGPNGAGKTTAVEAATGLQRVDSGTVSVLGRQPWGAGPEHRAQVGVMLQDGGLPQSVRPLALLHHLAQFYRHPIDVAALASRLGIDSFNSATVRRLSGGQRQRVALAAALVGRPRVVFLDEPTAGLDPHSRRDVHALVREVADAGATVLLTTHSFEEAERLADHVVVMVAGQAHAQGSVPDLAGDSSLEERYFALTDTYAAQSRTGRA